ncbi:hypothetical protein K3718_00650 [Leisingera aquaemixtae]|uniref:Uncharacterized protein n=1 Tax=Leisingera aquaemixtae TaxID=1396826 RepID=A0ABY5WJH9_9RHOB|nr:hypothetical protein [Leisingera aquaemixtae]UWQ41628.1 hypothetical protein K3718_00650 [Leisingera aquaemixtae]
MSNRSFLSAHSVIYAFFALALFFAPGLLWPNYGVELNDRYAWFLPQHNSIFLGGIAVICFLFRDASSGSKEGRKILTGLMWTNLLGLAVTFYAGAAGIFTGFGWSDPAFFALLSVLCFLQLRKG